MAQIVDPKLADECLLQYEKVYTSNNADLIQSAFTTSVSFSFKDITQFIAAASGSADTLEIKLGVYTQDFATQYNVQAGRLSVFLCTKNSYGVGDPPNDVYNTGDLAPPAPETY